MAKTLALAACLAVGGAGSGCCRDDECESGGVPGLLRCANSSGALREKTPRVAVVQLATEALWCSFCKYAAAVNAQWAKSQGHLYVVTPGDYISEADVWRGGNVRAVREMFQRLPSGVQWIFHLDCDAMVVSKDDVASRAIADFAGSDTRVLLSRDETGFAGGSRLTNMGTGLWRRSSRTLRFLDRAWQQLSREGALTEQEVVERLLKEEDAAGLVQLLPAGLLNSASSNPIAASRQLVIHLAGIPNGVRSAVFREAWQGLCNGQLPGLAHLREVFLRSFKAHVAALPDAAEPGADWARASEPARLARRLGLALHQGGLHGEEAASFMDLALRRTELLEARLQEFPPEAKEHFALLRESLAAPLLELGRKEQAEQILLKPWPTSLGARHPVDEHLRAQNLVALLVPQGRLDEAEKLARSSLLGLEAAFPASTRDVRPADARARLAQVLHQQGRWREAEPLMRQAVRELEASLGPDHPQALGGKRNLAVLLKQLPEHRHGQVLPEAEALLSEAAAGLAEALGPSNPEAQRAARNLANFRRWRQQRRSPQSQHAPARSEL